MTWTLFCLATLTSLGIHRIWNYEAITASLRARVAHLPMLGCAACNAFWIALGVCTTLTLTQNPGILTLAYALAIYPALRAAMVLESYVRVRTTVEPQSVPVLPTPVLPKKQCATCGTGTPATTGAALAVQDAEIKRHIDAATFEKRVVILTMLHDFQSSYSLTTVIIDQVHALARNSRWLVELWVTNTCKDTPPNLPPNVRVRRVVLPVPCAPDGFDQRAVTIVTDRLRAELIPLGNALVITHDLLFVSQFINYAAALHDIGNLRGFSWLHWCHSAPSERPILSAEDPRRFRYTVPKGNHVIVTLAPSLLQGMMTYYQTGNVQVVPNIRDPLQMENVSRPLATLIQHTKLTSVEVVQIYPVSTTRFSGKGLRKLIELFAHLSRKTTVRLVVCNPHANGEKGAALITQAKLTASRCGLPPECLHFTSELMPGTAAVGLSASEIRTLFQYGNLFAFPTGGEASSLVLMEAALAGNLLVLNRDVPALLDAFPESWDHSWGTEHEDGETSEKLARDIISSLESNVQNCAKRDVLRHSNLDTLQVRLTSLVNASYPGATPI